MNISGPAAVAKPEMLFYAPGDLTVTRERQSKVINSRSTIWGFVMSTEMVQRKTLEERRNGTANLQNKAMQLHSTSSVAVISTEMA